MFRKVFAVVTAAILVCLMLPVSVFAADNVVFMDVTNGSSANSGATADAAKNAFGSLQGNGAMAVLGSAGGTLVVSAKARPGSSYTFPEMNGPLTITALYDGISYVNPEPVNNPTAGVFKAASGAVLTIGTDTTFENIILFQENAQNTLVVPKGKTLTIADSVLIMTKSTNDFYWKIVVEEGGKAILSRDAKQKLTIENKGGIVETYGGDAVELRMTLNSTTAYVNGVAQTLDAAPVIRQNRTMLPVRFVAENLGATVGWDGTTATATLTAPGVTIEITIGATVAKVNGEAVLLDSPAFIENSRTYLPVRFVAERLGGEVAWDSTTATATITK